MLRTDLFALAALPLALGLAGCGGDSDSTGSGGSAPTKLEPADTKDFTHADGLITAKVAVDGQEGRLIVDSGAPVILLNTASFPNQMEIDTAKKVVVDDKRSFSDIQVIAAGSLQSPDPDVPIDGILGCTVICKDKATFDYRSGTLALGQTGAASGVGKLVKVPFSFEGGQKIQGITLPKSRVVVTVMIEGKPHSMIVDTGASSVTLRSTVFDDLVADGRPTMAGPTLETTAGTSQSTVARASSIAIGGVEAKDVIVLGDEAFDMFLDSVKTEVGHDIDGSLGGTYLGRYLLAIDYPNSSLELSAYDDPYFLSDLGHSLGFQLGLNGSTFVVGAVVPGSDAATKGVAAGDELVAIDGKNLADLTNSAVSVLASAGAVGSLHDVKFGTAKSSGVANQTLKLAIVDLLAAD